MSLFSALFGKKESSAEQAKNRLQLVLAQERGANALSDVDMQNLRADIVEVIKKYTKVKDIQIKAEKNQDIDVLELEVILDR